MCLDRQTYEPSGKADKEEADKEAGKAEDDPRAFPRRASTRSGGRAGWTGRRPGVWCLSGIRRRRLELTLEDRGRRRGLLPSPETATSGQSPHASYGYTKQDHLPSRVRQTISPGGAVQPAELPKHRIAEAQNCRITLAGYDVPRRLILPAEQSGFGRRGVMIRAVPSEPWERDPGSLAPPRPAPPDAAARGRCPADPAHRPGQPDGARQ
jgi:hypothetical protein